MSQPKVKLSSLQTSPNCRERLHRYARLVRLDRPIGIFLLMWPALWALWLAGDGQPAWNVVLVFVLGVVLMRSAGCAINDFADRDFDGLVQRTKDRPLATGLVSGREALGVFLLLSLLAFALVLTLDHRAVAGGVAVDRSVSVHEAPDASAAIVSGRGVWLGGADGF